MKYLPVIIIICVFLMPGLASAAGFVPCDGANVNGLKACSACDLVTMGNTILKWLIGILFVVFGVIVFIAGFKLVTSGGNPSALSDAKSKFMNAIIGLVIVLAAWLIVDTIMRGLLDGGTGVITGYGPWSTVQCQTQTATQSPDTGFTPPVNTYSFEMYEQDSANNCKIPHSGSNDNMSACALLQDSIPGTTYVVKYCDPAASLPTPPSWSSLPVCGISSTACTPLTPYAGTDPLGVTWTGADPGLQKCAQDFANSNGGTINSAYRPQAYQNHLKEIHTKWCAQGLSTNNDSACATVKSAVQTEMSSHGLNCSWPVANVSNHTSGLAVDISGVSNPPGDAATYNLTWFGSGDPVHYTFAAGSTCP